jgi:hypothetical protein
MNIERLRKQFDKQMVFLRTSCRLYDEGEQDEAIRIATAIRVLVHDTKNSISILSHLNATKININASPAANPDSVIYWSHLTEFELKIQNDGKGNAYHEARQLPIGIEGLCRSIPLDVWWNEPIMKTLEGTYTRRDIVLWATNKDGGAHVDATMPALYTSLVDGRVASGPAPEIPGYIGFFIDIYMGGKPASEAKVLANAHYSDLRQMATELMTSPDMIALLTK